jgi:hypothetical protein
VLCSAPRMVAVDVLDHNGTSASWKEVILSKLATPGTTGAQSCVALNLQTGHQHDESNFHLRIRIADTFGDARYACIYGLEVLVYQ